MLMLKNKFRFLLVTLAMLATGLMLYGGPTAAAPAPKRVNFDHLKTGFPLTGQHQQVQCETCHRGGVFAGTPKQCINCHVQGSRLASSVKPTNHAPTNERCDQCHTSTATWANARWVHTGITTNCARCHNGSIASGKSSSHQVTNAPCESCHSTSSWSGARVDHSTVTRGSCQTCHNGSKATGKSTNHILTNASCDSCHNTSAWLPATFNHATAATPGSCAGCHNNSAAKGKASTHVPTSLSCEACHGTTTFNPATFTHTTAQGVTAGGCGGCHNGSYAAGGAVGKGSTHLPTSLSCDRCHATGSPFTTSTFTHTAAQGVTSGSCSGCHNGAYTAMGAVGKTTNHVATSAACDVCHRTTAWTPAINVHANAAPGGCASCHGSSATGKGNGHIPTSLSCDACHTNTSPFTTETFNHTAAQGVTAGGCNTCHNGSYTASGAVGKGNGHIPTSLSCDRCHGATSPFTTSTFAHTSAQGVTTGGCNSCHNGAYTASGAVGKPANHITTSSSCDTCHSTTAWTPVNFNHGSVATPGSCNGCHNGTQARGKAATHVPTSLSCEVCHNTSTFNPSTFTHTAAQGVTSGGCNTCHNGSYTAGGAVGKATGHIPTSLSCDRCHAASSPFTTATFTHTSAQGVTAGGCNTCHNGAYTASGAVGKPTSHTTTASCDQCHRTTAWLPATFSHANATPGSCASASCHGGSATGKGSGHIPTSLSCDACHVTSSFGADTFAHTAAQGVTAGGCVTCHNGSYTAANAQGKSNTHIPTTLSCDRCHGTSTFTTSTFTHTTAQGVTTGSCNACHNGSYTASGAAPKSAAHIPTSALCDKCHNSKTTWTIPDNNDWHAAAGIVVGSSNCLECHNGSYRGYGADGPHVGKEGARAGQDCDDSGCHRRTNEW